MSYLNKRILFCGLNVDYLLIDLTSYKFGSDFSEITCFRFLIEALRLNDNHFVRHTSKFEKLQFARYFELFDRCVFCAKTILVWPEKVEVTTFFKAAKLPTSWLKIP